MPTITVPLPDITQSVYRPVVVDITGQIQEWTKIPKDVPIFYPNDEGFISSAGTGLDNRDDRLMRASATRRIEVKASETFAEDQQITDLTGRKGNVPVFVDRLLDVWMAPGYTSSQMTIDFEFKTNSKEEAHKWGASIASSYLQGRYALQNEVTYSFNMPKHAWEIIRQVYNKRENVAGYGETIEEWFKKCTTNRMVVISNETGSQRELTVTENQLRIQGFFSFTNDPDKPTFDQATGLYTIAFSFRFVYQKPATFDMHYPIIVHQQLLDRPFIDFVNRELQHDDRAVHRSQWLWGMKPFESMELQYYLKPRFPFIRIPYVDDYSFKYGFSGTAPYLTILMQQSAPTDRDVCNLGHLGDIILDEDILNFLRDGEYQHIGIPGKSIFHFDILKGDTLLSYPSAKLDKDLNLSVTKDIDMRKPYRVRCGLFTDLSFIDRAALDRLMLHPKAFQKVFGAINEMLLWDTSFQNLDKQRHIYPWQLSKLFEAIMGQGICNIYSGPTRGYATGNWGTNWLNQQRTFLTDIPESVLRAYRNSRRTQMNVQLFGIASWNKRRDPDIGKQNNLD